MALLQQVKAFTNSWVWIVTVFALPLSAMAVFALQQSRRGGVRISERVQQAGGSVFLNKWIKEYGYWWLSVPVRLLVHFRVTPNAITLGGFFVVLCGAILAAGGFFGLAGPLLLVGSLSDMLDGIVARKRDLCSDAGEFVDSVVDRYADICLCGGLCVYYSGRPLALAIVLSALLGSVVVSYSRAKAEALGIYDIPGGPMRRAERAVYLGFSIFLSPLVALVTESPSAQPMYYLALAMCGIIGLLANINAIQMTVYGHNALRKKTMA